MNTRTIKGQGALEYLLLIGGAVVVAAVVVVLLLNLSGTNTGQSETTAIGAILSQTATINGTNSCTDLSNKGAGDDQAVSYLWNTKTSSCYSSLGTYPNCAATKTAATVATACCPNAAGCLLDTTAPAATVAANLYTTI